MMLRRVGLALVFAVAGFGLGQAQTPAPAAVKANPDLRCMLMASVLSQNPDPKAKELSNIMMFYYLGRFDARNPNVPLQPALQAQAKLLTQAEANPEGQRCVAAVSTRVTALRAMGGQAPAAAAGQAPGASPAAK